jgi:hypothetical protein
VSRLITRRKFIVGAAAASVLAGCQTHQIKGFLGAMKDWNENFEGFVFSPNRLAPELPVSATTPVPNVSRSYNRGIQITVGEGEPQGELERA